MSLGLFWGRGFTDNRDQLQLVNTAFPSLGLLALRGFCDVLDTFPGLHGCGIFLTSLRVFRTGSQRPNVMLWHVLDVIDASVRQWSTVLLSSFKVSRWGPWPGSTFGKQPDTGRTMRWCPQLQRCPQWWDDRALVKNVGTLSPSVWWQRGAPLLPALEQDGSSCCATTLQRFPIPHMSRQAFVLQSRCLSKTKAAWILSVFSGMVQHFT